MYEGRIIPVGGEFPPMEPRPPRRAEADAGDNGRAAARPKRPKRSRSNARAGAVRQRFALLNAFLDLALPHLTRAEAAAWLLLYRHAKPDGIATASVADLARRTGCDESAIRRALKRLRENGLVERIKRGSLAGGPSVWRLTTPKGGAT